MASLGEEHRGDHGSSAAVISLDPHRRERIEQRAQVALRSLVCDARAALDAVLDGDIDAVHDACWAITRAVGIVLEHRMATAWTRWRLGI